MQKTFAGAYELLKMKSIEQKVTLQTRWLTLFSKIHAYAYDSAKKETE